MGHDVDVPATRPFRVNGVLVTVDRDAGVRAEQVDAAMRRDRLCDEPDDVRFARHIRRDRRPADFVRYLLRGRGVHVGDNHRLRALGREPAAQRAANPRAAARDNDDFACDLHLRLET